MNALARVLFRKDEVFINYKGGVKEKKMMKRKRNQMNLFLSVRLNDISLKITDLLKFNA